MRFKIRHRRSASAAAAADPNSGMKIVDLEGRKSHFAITTYDTRDGALKRQGVFVLVKEYLRRRKPKFVVGSGAVPAEGRGHRVGWQLTIKVNSVDPDTLHPPLSEPQEAFAKSTRQKLEQVWREPT